jgi:hypothetical protein
MLKWPSTESRKSDDVAPIHVIEHRNIHIPLMTKLSIPLRWSHLHFCAGSLAA